MSFHQEQAMLDMNEGVSYCFPHTFALTLTMQEHKLIHTESEKTCRTRTGNGYWILKSSYNRKMELALWHQGKKEVIFKKLLAKEQYACLEYSMPHLPLIIEAQEGYIDA